MMQESRRNWGWPLFMSFIRLPLILLGNMAIILAFRAAGQQAGLATGAVFATLSVTITNLVCLGLLLWRARVEGLRLGAVAGFQRRRFLRDLVAGALWSMALFVVLMGGVLAGVMVVRSTTGLAFEQIYLGEADFSVIDLPLWLTALYAIVAATVFPSLNAPVEELQYRGYAQSQLIAASGSVWSGIAIPAVGFGLQHIAFAYTLASAPAFTAGFFLWGVGAGVIAYRQKRLAQLIIAHFNSNLMFGIVPLFFMLSGI